MISINVGTAGSANLKKQFDELKKRASRQQIEHALRAGGAVVKRAVVDRTPVRADNISGTALPPGALKRDVHVKTIKDSEEPTVLVGQGAATAHVALWRELGHQLVPHVGVANGKRKRKEKSGFVKAHPTYRPAFEASGNDALQAALEDMKQQLGVE